jgi:hypothetical protein
MADAVQLLFYGPDSNVYAVAASANGNGGLPVVISGAAVVTGPIDLEQIKGVAVITGGVAGLLGIGGSSAAGATDDGSNPAKVGALVQSNPATKTNGQRDNLNVDTKGHLWVTIGDPNAINGASGVTGAYVNQWLDSMSQGPTGLATLAFLSLLSGPSGSPAGVRGRDISLASIVGMGTLAVAEAPSSVAGAAILPTATTVAASSVTLKSSAGNLYSLNVAASTAAGWVMVFDAATAPADGAVQPKKVYDLAIGQARDFQFTPPLRMAAGCTVVFSTTGPYTKTASSTAFISGEMV